MGSPPPVLTIPQSILVRSILVGFGPLFSLFPLSFSQNHFATMEVSATSHYVALTPNSITHRKRVGRLHLLRGRNRSPAFWSEEDWWFCCVFPFLPFLSAAHFRPVITVALIVFLNDVFNSTLGCACNIPCTLRFLRPAVPLFLSPYDCLCCCIGIPVKGPPPVCRTMGLPMMSTRIRRTRR